MCRRCQVWEVGAPDNFCSWCGLVLVEFEVTADRVRLPAGEYPPPVEVTVRNLSATREVDVESIAGSAGWISLLEPGEVPQRIGRGGEKRFLIEVDTIAAAGGGPRVGEVQVRVAHAGARSLRLEIV